MKLACVILAAGNSVRFGKNKLKARFRGESLFERALACVPVECFYKTVVVTQYEDLAKQAEKAGFTAVRNPEPDKGISLSLRLGLEQVKSADAVMFMVADQPWLQKSTVRGLVETYKKEPGTIVAPCFGKRRGNPVIFPNEIFDELSGVEGDFGGKTVIMAHTDKLRLMPIMNEDELNDVDTVEQLESGRFRYEQD
ncbi:MAG: Nicotine blue oxidoreductase [Firmicutes bacterium ADurb.Bin182]|nr:MAG: Nicotine blue oxidoreductase [Firmicutes bacterium ADurb.Bin182]